MQINVLGAGSWGSALAVAVSHVADVTIWSHQDEHVRYLSQHRNNPKYLPADIFFANNVTFSSNLADCIQADLLIIATPLNAIREVVRSLQQLTTNLPDLLLVSKGFEAQTGYLPHQILAEELPEFENYGLLIGPSFAKEVALSLPTAITLVSPQIEFAINWMNKLQDIPNFRIYAHDDVVGSEVGAAVKNVLAIAVGISDGLELGYNARAALITRSLSELASLVLALGGKRETIYGLTGIGDLILTCTGDLSRNRTVGQELAKGHSIDSIVKNLGHVAEGVSTAREIYHKAKQLHIDMPIVESVYRIIYEQTNIKQEVLRLLNRQPKSEFGE